MDDNTTNASSVPIEECIPENENAEHTLLFYRMWLVAFGSVLSVISIFNNALLFYMFAKTPKFRQSAMFYNFFLSVCDFLVSVNYICLFSVQVCLGNTYRLGSCMSYTGVTVNCPLCNHFYRLMHILQVIADYYCSWPLFKMWHIYLRVIFASSHLALSASAFLIMAATFERFVTMATNWKVGLVVKSNTSDCGNCRECKNL